MVKLDELPLEVLYIIALLLPESDRPSLCMANNKTLRLASFGIAVSYNLHHGERKTSKFMNVLEHYNTQVVKLNVHDHGIPVSVFLPHCLRTLYLNYNTHNVTFDLNLLPATIETLGLGKGCWLNNKRKGPSALSLLFRLKTLVLSRDSDIFFTKNDIPNVTKLVLAHNVNIERTFTNVYLSVLCPDKLEELDMLNVMMIVSVCQLYNKPIRKFFISECKLYFPNNIKTLIFPCRQHWLRHLTVEAMPKSLERLNMNNFILYQPLDKLKVLRTDIFLAKVFLPPSIDMLFVTKRITNFVYGQCPAAKTIVFEENFTIYPISDIMFSPETTCIMIKYPPLNFAIDPLFSKKIKIVLNRSELVKQKYSHFKKMLNEQIVLGDVPEFS